MVKTVEDERISRNFWPRDYGEAPAEVVAVGVAAELFPKLRKNMFTGMNQNHAEHLGFEVRIIGESPFQKIVYAAGCFNAGKCGPRNDECQERRTSSH